MGQVRKTRRRGLRTDPDIRGAAIRLAQSGDGWTAAGIHRKVLEEHPTWKARMPDVRTIQNIVRGLAGLPGEPWTFSGDDPQDGALVLAVLGELLDAGVRPGAPGPTKLTVAEAAYIARLRRAFPDMPGLTVLAVSRAYLLAGQRSTIYTTEGLDRYLAFTPWRDGAARYVRAFVEGTIREYFGMPLDPSDDAVLRMMRDKKTKARDEQRAADVHAGANPFLDGRLYWPEEKK